MSDRLKGQVAIITGASRGLGQYCAAGFAQEGARVAVVARTEEEKDQRLPGTIHHTADLIRRSGGEALAVVCNVADPASVQAMVESVLGEWGRIDILMNNAAIQPPGEHSDIQEKHWNLMYNINVNGPLRCIRAVLPTMLQQKHGNIINISSAATLGGSPYGGTKRALEAMTEGLAAELRNRGIAVNALKPVSAIETPGFRFAQLPREESQASAAKLPPPDSYVEAAVLLACQTPDTYTGRINNDAEVLAILADPATQERMRKLNPEDWVAAMDGS
ncbi:MAG: SDR family oxidoreductase [Pseudomonadales bacterium]|nr:SDR family oxidoreductase [Pseudomonadales bacterium]